MKYSSQSYDQEDEGGGDGVDGGSNERGNGKEFPLVIIRHKRAKVEPLSPPSTHSDDELEDSSLSLAWSDEQSSGDEELGKVSSSRTSRIRIKLEPTEGVKLEDSEAAIGGGDNSSDETEEEEEGEDEEDQDRDQNQDPIDKSEERIPVTPNVPVRSETPSKTMVASTITTTTPPQTPPPEEIETAIATNLGDDDDDDVFDSASHEHNERIINSIREDCRHGGHRAPNTGRGRAEETKLSEEQRAHLKLITNSIKEGRLNKLHELLEGQRGFKRNLLNVFVEGQTALHRALILGRGLSWCKLLIANGADPNLTNRAGWHPIHLAAHSSSKETMSYIISCLEPE